VAVPERELKCGLESSVAVAQRWFREATKFAAADERPHDLLIQVDVAAEAFAPFIRQIGQTSGETETVQKAGAHDRIEMFLGEGGIGEVKILLRIFCRATLTSAGATSPPAEEGAISRARLGDDASPSPDRRGTRNAHEAAA
jgi:hypothetical protein